MENGNKEIEKPCNSVWIYAGEYKTAVREYIESRKKIIESVYRGNQTLVEYGQMKIDELNALLEVL